MGDTGDPRKGFCTSSGDQAGPEVLQGAVESTGKVGAGGGAGVRECLRGRRQRSGSSAGGCSPSPLWSLPGAPELGHVPWGASTCTPIPTASVGLQAALGECPEWEGTWQCGPGLLWGVRAGAQSGEEPGRERGRGLVQGAEQGLARGNSAAQGGVAKDRQEESWQLPSVLL